VVSEEKRFIDLVVESLLNLMKPKLRDIVEKPIKGWVETHPELAETGRKLLTEYLKSKPCRSCGNPVGLPAVLTLTEESQLEGLCKQCVSELTSVEEVLKYLLVNIQHK